MAGEFPDRSKQRESSEEPTSGSTGPVPEARDPRLAVARDAEPPTARGGVDTATRVISARDVAKARAAARGEAENATSDAESTETKSGENGTAETSADAGASAPGAGTADAGDEAAGESSGASDASGGAGDAGDAEGSKASGGADGAEDPRRAEAAGGAKASKAADEAAPAEDAGAEDAEDVQDAVVAEDGTEAPKGDATGDARLRAAVAAWVRTGDSAATADSGDEDAAAEAGEGPESAEKADAVPEPDSEPEDRADGAVEPAEPEDQAVTSVKDAEPGPEADDEDTEAFGDATDEHPESDKQPADSAEAPAKPAAASATPGAAADKPGTAASKPGAAAASPGAASASPGTAAESPAAAGKPATDKPAVPTDRAPTDKAPSDQAPADKPAALSDKAPSDQAPADKPAAPADKAPADKATPAPGDKTRAAGPVGDAVKAAPAADAPVDQPTTMLKLPSAAERTSKFVALKPDVTSPVPQVGPERTTQQPLPPKPPLDLLAELTNTPRPPETPLRTTVRRVKIWTPLVLLLLVVFAIAQSLRPLPSPTLELTAEDSYSFDGGKVDIPWPADGQAALDVQGIGTFGSSGEQKPVPIASVAKVMTAYIILRDHPLKSGAEGPKIKIDQTAEDQSKAGQESTVNVTAGDSISQREALESILIASANNVARLLARWDAGSEKAFVEKMNAAAEDLGMKNTTYTDPSGLNDTTVSTAVDQVKLGKKAMEEPAFREVAAMMSYDDYKGVNHGNWNQIVGKNNVVGIKTGTTTSALGNLLFAAKKEVDGETRTIVGAVIRQPAGGVDNTILSAALTAGDQLIRAAQGALKSATIIKKGEVVGYVDDGLGGKTPVIATKDVTAVGWSGLTVKLTFAGDDVPHTAKAGTKVGTLTVGDASAGAVSVPVALQKDLVEPGFTDKLTRIA
ncbi:D-alanyl-D-alanine carboxypeptidase [Streptomyces sp. RG80]|uniref:D-alanyl-D-alanine carboxypeptidase n=1 Tax=Streptomyces sp. RG80 TaxID=3157340 RepID=UPI00338EA28D